VVPLLHFTDVLKLGAVATVGMAQLDWDALFTWCASQARLVRTMASGMVPSGGQSYLEQLSASGCTEVMNRFLYLAEQTKRGKRGSGVASSKQAVGVLPAVGTYFQAAGRLAVLKP
jgi:hypothetical protein